MKLEELITKYSGNIPRYTSFPTVPDWKNNITNSMWIKEISSSLKNEAISLYLHIPFCTKLCTFCACNKLVTENYENVLRYIEAVEREIVEYKNLVGFKKIRVSQFHIGGGTPTFLRPLEMNVLFNMMDQYFEFESDAEKSIEAHPEFTTKEQMNILKEHGFNRISFGIQDFDPNVQEIINRTQSYQNIADLTNFAKNVGFDSINFDFIYGLPKQNLDSITQIVSGVKELMPNRIAFYGYAHVPWKSTLQRKYSESDLPSPIDRIRMFLHGKEGFELLGYKPIGMDHFALETDELVKSYANGTLHRNFMGYTIKHSQVLLGLGVSSISETPNAYKQNTKNLSHYYKNQQEIETSHLLTLEEINTRRKIIEIMTQFTTNIEVTTPKLQEMCNDGLIVIQGNKMIITEIGRMFVRNIAAEFDVNRKNTNGKFSQSV